MLDKIVKILYNKCIKDKGESKMNFEIMNHLSKQNINIKSGITRLDNTTYWNLVRSDLRRFQEKFEENLNWNKDLFIISSKNKITVIFTENNIVVKTIILERYNIAPISQKLKEIKEYIEIQNN